ncbi:MAG: metallophosphoesterase [Clostridia bacterium]|nr:metallophosphoesterase [Clostridia bacterium]
MERLIASLVVLLMVLEQALSFGKAGYDIAAAKRAVAEAPDAVGSEFTGVSSEETWSPDDPFSMDDCFTLTKPADRDFVILNITDTHFSDYDIRALYAFDESRTIRKLVDKYRPDLITVTGDVVCGDSTKYSIERLTELFDSFGVPWAPVFGNHEIDENCDLNYLADVMMTSEHCLFRKGDPEMGVGNYVINVAGPDGTVVETILMMHSHKSQINEKQLQWAKWVREGVNAATGSQPELTFFFHIPLPDYQYAYDAAWDADKKQWRDGYGAAGTLNEKICCERDDNGEPLDRGVFTFIKELGVRYVFCGHEHNNDFTIDWDGVRLTYCLKVGKASGYYPGLNGGTAIRVGSEGITRITSTTFIAGIAKDIVDVTV